MLRLLRSTMPPPRVAGGRLFSSLPPPPLPSRREAHIWYLLPDEMNDASQLKMYGELLSPYERKVALSKKGERLQKAAILSRALVRTTLSRSFIEDGEKLEKGGFSLFYPKKNGSVPVWRNYADTCCGIDARAFEFKKNKFGKPEILWRPDDNSIEHPLHFNISHTPSLIACGIAVDVPIGIDVEEKKRKTVMSILALARRYFSPSEVEYLATISDSDAQQKEFIKLWTLKEAYVKALGRGFSGAPFSNFTILLETSKGIRISRVPGVRKDSNFDRNFLTENWQFALAELNSSHYMAICIEDDSENSGSNDDQPLQLGLKVWKTVPFVEDTLVSGTEAVKFIT